MKINWRIRLKNKVFIVSLLSVVIPFTYQILGLFNLVPKISQSEVTNYAMMIINLLAGLGILVDPTTKGVSDSERALSYK